MFRSPNKSDFRDCLKESKVSPGLRSAGGRSFHSRGPAAEKLLSTSFLCVRGTSSFRMSLELMRNPTHPFYLHQSAPPVKNWMILLMQSFTAGMPLLMAASAFRLRRRRLSSQRCYLDSRLSPYLVHTTVLFDCKSLLCKTLWQAEHCSLFDLL